MRTILFLFITFLTLHACDQNTTTTSSKIMANENAVTKTEPKVSDTIKPILLSQQNSDVDLTAEEHKWRFDMCNLWKINDCADPESASCKYWQPSETHLGMSPELCVKAMLATLEFCSRNEAFFQINPRDCDCVEQQYKVTTRRPNLDNKEGPLFAKECFAKAEY